MFSTRHSGEPVPAPKSTSLVLLGLVVLILASGCAPRIPFGTSGALPFNTQPDTLFLSPVCFGSGGNFQMDRRLEKSRGDGEAYLRVWQGFLEEECKRRSWVLVRPLRSDSLAVAAFPGERAAGRWLDLYGLVPGERSRVLEVRALRLESLRRNVFLRFFESINLLDDSGREFGWLELDYEVHEPARGGHSGLRRLVSREADSHMMSARTDRAGRLMMKGARDVARLLEGGARP
ncbi:MAG: hypothetical protein Q8O14_15015 [bacterium]|nr:hypothetical protein [bacterium]